MRDRPDRRVRRAAGKSDPGTVEAIRALHVVRASAIKARTQTIKQIKSLIITAPAAVREALHSLTATELIRRLVTSRPGADRPPLPLPTSSH
ncbi:hypothetical protein ABZX95_19980 [Streptomyces sp. NPDC004232]|uniref:hypothetical protein n=1 Tax=Streptomyces sp. NPDC004232 TaxID=3154454 RepID=UPI0033B23700